MAFDPKAYLAEKDKAFDPKAYLKGRDSQSPFPQPPKPSAAEPQVQQFDPASGAATGFTEPAPQLDRRELEAFEKQTSFPTAYGKGAVAGILGSIGSLQEMKRQAERRGAETLGVPVPERLPRVLPTTEELSKKFATVTGKGANIERGIMTAGEILGIPSVPGVGALAGAGRIGRAARYFEASDNIARGLTEMKSGLAAPYNKLAADQKAAVQAIEQANEKLARSTESLSKEISAMRKEAERVHQEKMAEISRTAQEKANLLRSQGTAQGEQQAQQILAEANDLISRSKENLDILRRNAAKVEERAAAGFKQVGEVKTPTENFTPVANKAAQELDQLRTTRKNLDDNLRSARNEIVQANESAGKTIDQTEAYKRLMSDLEQVAVFDPATSQTLMRVTEPNTASLYKRVYDALKLRRVELTKEQAQTAAKLGYEVQQVGDKFYRTFKTSFDALDDVRRFVGEVYRGQAPEGFQAISGKLKEKIYGDLSRIQDEFVGAAQKELQASYRNYSQQLEKFDTKFGRALTETEEGLAQAATDPAKLGEKLFSSRTSVDNAITLTNDAKLVEKTAADYAATSIANMNASQVRAWINTPKNADWLSHPSMTPLRQNLERYASNLTRQEATAQAVARRQAAPVVTEGKALSVPEAQAAAAKEAEAVRGAAISEAEKAAGKVESAAKAEQAAARKELSEGRISLAEYERRAKKTITQEAKTAEAQFKEAAKQPSYVKEYNELKNFADAVVKSDGKGDVFSYEALHGKMKQFLRAQVESGVLSPEIAVREAKKLDDIIAMQNKLQRRKMLKEEMVRFGSGILRGSPGQTLGSVLRMMGR